MAKLSRVADTLAKAIDWPPGEVRHFARRAREGGELTSTGARGNAAPDATTRDASNLTISVMAAPFAKDAATTIKEYRSLSFYNDEGNYYGYGSNSYWVPWSIAKDHGYSEQRTDLFRVLNRRAYIRGDGVEEDVVLIRRVPKEFSWLHNVDKFGDAFDRIIEMARDGSLREVSMKECGIYSMPRIRIYISSPRLRSAKIVLNDEWEPEEPIKIFNSGFYSREPVGLRREREVYGAVFLPKIKIEKAIKPDQELIDRWDWMSKFTEEPFFTVEKKINQGVIEALGEVLRE